MSAVVNGHVKDAPATVALLVAGQALDGAGLEPEQSGARLIARCPTCKPDALFQPSLSISASDTGTVKAICANGCSEDAIRGAVTLPPATGALRARVADLSRVRPIEWAWHKRLPVGYLSLLLGAEGIGKGTLIAWLVARISRGELPGDLEGQPARVLIIGDEDSFDSVVAPRLFAAGADLSLVHTLDEDEDTDYLDIRRDAPKLRRLIHDNDYKLIVLDALLDNLDVGVDDWRSKAVRDALRPLRRVARDLDISVLASMHPNKGARSNFRDLISGTHAFNASSRSSLLLAKHPDDEDRRVLVRGKGNLSAAPGSFEFTLAGRAVELNGHGFDLPVVTGATEGDLSVEDLLTPDRPAPVRDTLADEINAVGSGEIQTRAEIARAVGREPSDRSVGRALEQLEEDQTWLKEGRGKWRKIGTHVLSERPGFGIGVSNEPPMSTLAPGGTVEEKVQQRMDDAQAWIEKRDVTP